MTGRRRIAVAILAVIGLLGSTGADGCAERKARQLPNEKTSAEGVHVVTMEGYSGAGGWAVRIRWTLIDGNGRIKETDEKVGTDSVSARLEMSTRDRSLRVETYTPSGKDVACVIRTAAKGLLANQAANGGEVTCTITGEALS